MDHRRSTIRRGRPHHRQIHGGVPRRGCAGRTGRTGGGTDALHRSRLDLRKSMNRVRAAYRWQKESGAVPWKNRAGIALAIDGMFLAAGWVGHDHPWVVLAACTLPISLLAAGI